jgi:hypothetical protein
MVHAFFTRLKHTRSIVPAVLAAYLLAALLAGACRSTSVSPDLVQAAYAAALQRYWQDAYAGYQAARADDAAAGELPRFLAPYHLDRSALPELPTAVQDAYSYYQRQVEAKDWGSVYLYAVPILSAQTYAVRTTTDGDDGWLEIYAADGALLGAARTYIELVAWDDVAALRAQTATGAFPPTLADRQMRTLWK